MSAMRTIIVAYNTKFVIGNGLGLPWRISEDLKLFRRLTMGHPCIMGRTTWDVMPPKYKPLPGRTNIVVSRKPLDLEGAETFASVESALKYAMQCDEQEVFITGGAQIYWYALGHNLVDRVLASEIKNDITVENAVYFPQLKALGWKGQVVEEFDEFTLMDYRKLE